MPSTTPSPAATPLTERVKFGPTYSPPYTAITTKGGEGVKEFMLRSTAWGGTEIIVQLMGQPEFWVSVEGVTIGVLDNAFHGYIGDRIIRSDADDPMSADATLHDILGAAYCGSGDERDQLVADIRYAMDIGRALWRPVRVQDLGS